ncbi:MAG: methionyl-tRNA formyltransferase [Anaerovoracaceae bacterium]
MSETLKIVYMGTPEFAVPPLKALVNSGYDISLVVTQPDKAKGRGKKLQPTPVKEEALSQGLNVSQPEKIRSNDEFLEKLRDISPNIIIVAAYGKILPKELLDIPSSGCINIHASLLPRFRGAAPIQRAILEGDEKTGITLMYMEEGLDTGDMIAKSETNIGNKTADELHDELADMGAELLIEYLPRIISGDIFPEKQSDELSCYAPMISKNDGFIDFSRDAAYVGRQIRAMDSWPAAFTYMNGQQMKIKKAVVGVDVKEVPGTVVKADKDGIVIACGRGSIVVKLLQMPGKRVMTADEYLRGNSIKQGLVLGTD